LSSLPTSCTEFTSLQNVTSYNNTGTTFEVQEQFEIVDTRLAGSTFWSIPAEFNNW